MVPWDSNWLQAKSLLPTLKEKAGNDEMLNALPALGGLHGQRGSACCPPALRQPAAETGSWQGGARRLGRTGAWDPAPALPHRHTHAQAHPPTGAPTHRRAHTPAHKLPPLPSTCLYLFPPSPISLSLSLSLLHLSSRALSCWVSFNTCSLFLSPFLGSFSRSLLLTCTNP